MAGKIFAILSPEEIRPPSLSNAIPLSRWSCATSTTGDPGYHLNKAHWNTVTLNGTVPDRELKKMISHSYEQVVAGLPKTLRDKIARVEWPRVKRLYTDP